MFTGRLFSYNFAEVKVVSTRTMLALFLLALSLTFLRGYFALGPAGIVWHLTELPPLSELTSRVPATPQPSDPLVLDVNTASAEQLEQLPGIGPALAARIIEYRTNSGGISSVEELLEVNGIGEVKLNQIRPFLVIGERDAD